MKNLCILLCFVFLCSCVQKLIDEPDNLISEEKITNILYDLAILNAAKSTNSKILKNNGIEPMQYLFSKYEIDSVQFVESNRYYASLPEEYENIYTAINERLKSESKRMEDAKKSIDSVKTRERKTKSDEAKKKSKSDVKKVNDSLQ